MCIHWFCTMPYRLVLAVAAKSFLAVWMWIRGLTDKVVPAFLHASRLGFA